MTNVVCNPYNKAYSNWKTNDRLGKRHFCVKVLLKLNTCCSIMPIKESTFFYTCCFKYIKLKCEIKRFLRDFGLEWIETKFDQIKYS